MYVCAGVQRRHNLSDDGSSSDNCSRLIPLKDTGAHMLADSYLKQLQAG